MPNFSLKGRVKLTETQQAALTALLGQLQNPFSPNSHRWLMPEQLADRFGLSLSEVEKVVTGFEARGFTVMPRARGGNFVAFSDTAAQVRAAFQTEFISNGLRKGSVSGRNSL